jgi:hypothetical protein
MKKKAIAAALFGVLLAGCRSQLPLMTVEQQKTYNEYMNGRYSGEADTFLFGPLGWAYHDSLRRDCYGSATAVTQSSAEASIPSAITPGSPATQTAS